MSSQQNRKCSVPSGPLQSTGTSHTLQTPSLHYLRCMSVPLSCSHSRFRSIAHLCRSVCSVIGAHSVYRRMYRDKFIAKVRGNAAPAASLSSHLSPVRRATHQPPLNSTRQQLDATSSTASVRVHTDMAPEMAADAGLFRHLHCKLHGPLVPQPPRVHPAGLRNTPLTRPKQQARWFYLKPLKHQCFIRLHWRGWQRSERTQRPQRH